MNDTANDEFSQLREDYENEQQEKLEREILISELDALKDENSVNFNSIAEKFFCENLCKLIVEFNGRLYERDAINESAFRLNISPVTARRYLGKHTTRKAQFFIESKKIFCKFHNHDKDCEIKVFRKNNPD